MITALIIAAYLTPFAVAFAWALGGLFPADD